MFLHQGLHMDPGKLLVVLNWPHLQGVSAFNVFFGFANYYCHFIPHYPTLEVPTSALTKKVWNAKTWIPEAEWGSLSITEKDLTSASVLNSPDHSRPFFLELNAPCVYGQFYLKKKKAANGKPRPVDAFPQPFFMGWEKLLYWATHYQIISGTTC